MRVCQHALVFLRPAAAEFNLLPPGLDHLHAQVTGTTGEQGDEQKGPWLRTASVQRRCYSMHSGTKRVHPSLLQAPPTALAQHPLPNLWSGSCPNQPSYFETVHGICRVRACRTHAHLALLRAQLPSLASHAWCWSACCSRWQPPGNLWCTSTHTWHCCRLSRLTLAQHPCRWSGRFLGRQKSAEMPYIGS